MTVQIIKAFISNFLQALKLAYMRSYGHISSYHNLRHESMIVERSMFNDADWLHTGHFEQYYGSYID